MKKILVPALLAVSLLAAPVYAGNPAAAKASSSLKAADKTYKVQPS